MREGFNKQPYRQQFVRACVFVGRVGGLARVTEMDTDSKEFDWTIGVGFGDACRFLGASGGSASPGV